MLWIRIVVMTYINDIERPPNVQGQISAPPISLGICGRPTGLVPVSSNINIPC